MAIILQSQLCILHPMSVELQSPRHGKREQMNPLTISSGLMTPNWISLICRIGADEYGNEIVILGGLFCVSFYL
jgi:hypothetical protein